MKPRRNSWGAQTSEDLMQPSHHTFQYPKVTPVASGAPKPPANGDAGKPGARRPA